MTSANQAGSRGLFGFSTADFLTLICAALMLIAFFMPWITWGDTTYSGMRLASGKPTEEYPFDVATLSLIPLVAIIGGGLALINILNPRYRSRSINLILVAGIVGLVPFVVFFAQNNQIEIDATGQASIGFWIALLATLGLVLQAFVPRPEIDLESLGETDILTAGPLRIVVSFVVPVLTFIVLRWSFIFMRDVDANRLAIGAVAILVGVGGVWVLFILTNYLVEQLPMTARDRVRPFVFVGPALVILFVYLIYPMFNTLYLSLLGPESERFVGLDNYVRAFSEPDLLIILRNNALWIVLVTSFAVGFGLIIAVLVDRIGRWEPIAKSLVFVPMAISAVGASVIWKFMYFVRAEEQTQIGLLNAAITGLGGMPTNFLENRSINNFALITIMIWLLTGFCMVVLSAAIKGVPTELLEASRIDGANEIQVFTRVIVPVIRPTIVTIGTTVLIMVLKVFDIVYVMTGGRRETQVIANRMFLELFRGGSIGLGSALAMILLIAVSPVIISNLRELRLRRG